MQCPLMFRLRTVDRLPEPGSLATHKGTVVHGVLERLYDLPVSERRVEVALELLPGQWESHREKSPEVMGLFEDPTQVETWLEEARGLMRVVDYKTGRSPGTRFVEEALFQMRFYALVLWRLRGRAPTRLQLVYLKDGRVLTHDPRLAELERTETRLTHLWDEVEDCARTGSFRPQRSRLCDWCAFQAQCPIFGGTTPQIPDDGLARLLSARRTAA